MNYFSQERMRNCLIEVQAGYCGFMRETVVNTGWRCLVPPRERQCDVWMRVWDGHDIWGGFGKGRVVCTWKRRLESEVGAVLCSKYGL